MSSKLRGDGVVGWKAMQVIDDNNAKDGLAPIFVYADRGTFREQNIRLGSRGDGYYEYLIKQYLQTSQQEPAYLEMWNDSLAGIKKHLITYSYPNNFTVLAERPNGLHKEISAKMDHLVCFMGGTLALATTSGKTVAQAKKDGPWGDKQEEDMRLAHELTKTCMGMYRTATGLAPEIAHFQIHEPPIMYNDFPQNAKPQSPAEFAKCKNSRGSETEEVGHDDYVFKAADLHNLQRPETVESLFYMWRITGDEIYRKWGWEMFQAWIKYTAVEDGEGFSSISNVMEIPVNFRDNMESFWMVSDNGIHTRLFADMSAGRDTEILLPPLLERRHAAIDRRGFQHRSSSIPTLRARQALQDWLATQKV